MIPFDLDNCSSLLESNTLDKVSDSPHTLSIGILKLSLSPHVAKGRMQFGMLILSFVYLLVIMSAYYNIFGSGC